MRKVRLLLCRQTKHNKTLTTTLTPYYLLLPPTCSFSSRTGRSAFVPRWAAWTLSRPAPAGFRERRTAPFRVRAKRQPPNAVRPAAATTKADGAARRRPRTRPAGDTKPATASRRDTKALRAPLDLQDRSQRPSRNENSVRNSFSTVPAFCYHSRFACVCHLNTNR